MPQNKCIISEGKLRELESHAEIKYVVFGGGVIKKNRLWNIRMHILSIYKLFSIFVVEVIK